MSSSQGLIAISVLCVTVIIVAGILAYVALKLDERRRAPEEASRQRLRDAEDRLWRVPAQPDPEIRTGWSSFEEKEPVERETTGQAALPVDPKNPPKTIRFPMNEPNPPQCICHGRTVEGGQRVVAWPVGAGYRFFCTGDE